MFSTAVIIFREIFEIALILGVVMAATRGLAARGRFIFLGIVLGVVGAGLIAYFASEISNMAYGMGQEVFNAGILLAATIMIGWTVIWMSRHAADLSGKIKKVGEDISCGDASFYALSCIIALAILREGAEIVLFTYGMLASGQSVVDIAYGSILGTLGGVISGLLVYSGLIIISTKYIFSVTTWFLILIAAGMSAIAAGYLTSVGYFVNLSDTLWDTSAIISENSAVGQVLHVLIGYIDRPMQVQVLFYLVTCATLIVGVYGNTKLFSKRRATS